MNELVDGWLKKAEKDLKTVDKIIEDPDLTNIVAFHSQQCIEKTFKAMILTMERAIEFSEFARKIYDHVLQIIT